VPFNRFLIDGFALIALIVHKPDAIQTIASSVVAHTEEPTFLTGLIRLVFGDLDHLHF
jgi:hypothetical protein